MRLTFCTLENLEDFCTFWSQTLFQWCKWGTLIKRCCLAARPLACCICMKCWNPSSIASLMRGSTLSWTRVRLTWTAQGKTDLLQTSCWITPLMQKSDSDLIASSTTGSEMISSRRFMCAAAKNLKLRICYKRLRARHTYKKIKRNN